MYAYKFTFSKNFYLSLAALAVIGIFLFPHVGYFSSITEERIIELTNQVRRDNGLAPVTANQLLSKAAYEKAYDIFEKQEFGHNFKNRKFSDWVKEANYQYSYVGENLAIDFLTSEGAIQAWMKSPSHRRNILNNRYQEIGVAIVEGDFNKEKSILIVQIFGTPLIKPAELSRQGKPFLNNKENQEVLLTHSNPDATSSESLAAMAGSGSYLSNISWERSLIYSGWFGKDKTLPVISLFLFLLIAILAAKDLMLYRRLRHEKI